MKQFKDYDEIKDTYDTGKYNIFYEKDETKFEVRNIGSSIYCHNVERNLGMGVINTFPIEGFYAVDKPIEIKETETLSENNEG